MNNTPDKILSKLKDELVSQHFMLGVNSSFMFIAFKRDCELTFAERLALSSYFSNSITLIDIRNRKTQEKKLIEMGYLNPDKTINFNQPIYNMLHDHVGHYDYPQYHSIKKHYKIEFSPKELILLNILVKGHCTVSYISVVSGLSRAAVRKYASSILLKLETQPVASGAVLGDVGGYVRQLNEKYIAEREKVAKFTKEIEELRAKLAVKPIVEENDNRTEEQKEVARHKNKAHQEVKKEINKLINGITLDNRENKLKALRSMRLT